MKINMDVIKCGKRNATTRLMRFQNFWELRKNENFRENFEKYGNFEFHRIKREEVYEMKRHSTSPPCGNLVDGLPHDCHMKTIAKLARLGPAENDELVTKFGRVDNNFLDEAHAYAKKMLSSVY